MPNLNQDQTTEANSFDTLLKFVEQLKTPLNHDSIGTAVKRYELFIQAIPDLMTLISLPSQPSTNLIATEAVKFILENNLLSRYVQYLGDLNILISHFPSSKNDILNAFLDSKKCEPLHFNIKLLNFFSTPFYSFVNTYPEFADKAVKIMLNSTENFRIIINSLQNLIDCTEFLPKHKKAIFDVYINAENFCYYIKNIDDFEKIQRFFADLFKNKNGFRQKMSTAILDLLNQYITKHPDADFVPLIIDFLKQTDSLYFKKVDRLWIAYELFLIATNSEKIKQGETSLCGAAVFLTTLFDVNPKLAVKLFLELIQTGKTNGPLKLQANTFSKENHEDVSFIFLCALKEASNSLVGYSPCQFQNSQFQKDLETFRGITEPTVLCRWLRQCGFQGISEAMIVKNSEGKEASPFMRFLYGGVYDRSHQLFKTLEENLKAAIEKINSDHIIIMMLSSQLSRKIIPSTDLQSHNDKVKKIKPFIKAKNNSFLGLMVEHYVVVKDLNYNKATGIVKITICSGGIKKKAILSAETFFAHYSGFISAKRKQEVLEPHKVSAPDPESRTLFLK